jgi:hypothetical protein
MKRTSDKRWWACVWIGLFAPIMVWASDYRLEETVYPPGDPLQGALGLPHNGPAVVTAEINDQVIRQLLARAAGVKNLEKTQGIRLTVSADEWSATNQLAPIYALSHYTLRYPTVEARELFSEGFQMQIKKYLTIRLTGHTRDFAVASFSRPLKGVAHSPRSTDVVLNAYNEVPETLLKLWKEDGKAVGYYLVDGNLAWTFRFMGSFPYREVVDAQEFNSKLEEVFAEAREKAAANLAAREVVRGLGYCHAYWAELKKVLREDYKIRWWCPTDLNSGVYD